MIHFRLGDIATALEFYLKSLKIFEGTGNRQGQAANLNNIAAIYTEQQKFDEARGCLIRAEGIVRERGGKNLLRKIYLSLGELEMAGVLGDGPRSKVLEYADQALVLAGELKSKAGQAEALLLQARIGKSRNKFKEAIAIFEELKQPMETAKAHYYYGRVMSIKDAVDRARNIFEKLGAKGWLARTKAV